MSGSTFPLTFPKMFGNILHPSPDCGRVRRSICQRLFKDYIQKTDKNEPRGDMILPLTKSKGLLVVASKMTFRCLKMHGLIFLEGCFYVKCIS